MAAELMPFDYEGQSIRTVLIDNEPWFVLADLCTVLEISNSRMVASRLDEAGVSQADISSGGQMRSVTIVNESGMYEVVIRSDKPGAVTFRRWITGTVLPAIRKTGSFSPRELSRLELIDMARDSELGRIAAEDRAVELSGQVAELTPKARTWETFLSSSGDYSVNEAAKVLSRDHGILTGQGRLFTFMEKLGWIYRDAKNKPVPYQTQVDNGRLVAKAQFHHHPETGEVVADAPQVRVTVKGLDALRVKHLMQVAS